MLSPKTDLLIMASPNDVACKLLLSLYVHGEPPGECQMPERPSDYKDTDVEYPDQCSEALLSCVLQKHDLNEDQKHTTSQLTYVYYHFDLNKRIEMYIGVYFVERFRGGSVFFIKNEIVSETKYVGMERLRTLISYVMTGLDFTAHPRSLRNSIMKKMDDLHEYKLSKSQIEALPETLLLTDSVLNKATKILRRHRRRSFVPEFIKMRSAQHGSMATLAQTVAVRNKNDVAYAK